MRNKIGILTFHRSLNYGSALQAWALSYTIQGLCQDESEIIDYVPNYYKEQYGMFWLPVSKKKIKYDILHLLMLPFFLRRKRDFSKFCRLKLPLSNERIISKERLEEYALQYKTIICGSDQIWNPRAIDFDEAFFLPEVKNTKKISYAVSVGDADLEEAGKDYLRKCILDFDYLSTREASSTQKVKRFIEKEKRVETVLDPTFLVSKSEYEMIFTDVDINNNNVFKPKEPYIFFYSVHLEKESMDDAIAVGHRYQLPIYTMVSGAGTFGFLKKGRQLRICKGDVGPCGFLYMLKNAEYVITDSFHGTAFSIIFEKNFISINIRKANGELKNDERINHIIHTLNLADRFITSEELSDFDFQSNIDYSTIKGSLNNEVVKAIKYLKEAI